MRKAVQLARTAERDIRRMGPGPERRRVLRALADTLEAEPPPANADIKALAGSPPWLRLRVGDWRVIYRPLTIEERLAATLPSGDDTADEVYLVWRIVTRGELERAVEHLP
jgi:mRNA-degrading endonuclease RelE of RelBE toxin-antitoxin system